MNIDPKLENFIRAFSEGGYCRYDCECGKIFYENTPSLDWDDGEWEGLTESEAIPTMSSVSLVSIPGVKGLFVDHCSCWYEKAREFMEMIDPVGHQLSAYFRMEKKRCQKEASLLPEINEVP